MTVLKWKIGVEIELLAPSGYSRRDLAQTLANRRGGTIRRFFHPQAEPGKVPGQPVFENLTLGFTAVDVQGRLIAHCVDDLTLQDNLDKQRPSQAGWYRIISDDNRLLQLVMQQSDPAAPLEQVLQPIAQLFGAKMTNNNEGMFRVADETGAPIAIAAPLPGERERPCELVTPPIESDHLNQIDGLLTTARELGFTAPVEGATHIHFDATALCSPLALANLVRLLDKHGADLKQLVGTNPHCRRLGGWPQELLSLVQSPTFLDSSWEQARQLLIPLKLSKYCDFNIRNFIYMTPSKQTFEVRILPVSLQAQSIMEEAGLFEAILQWAIAASDGLKPLPADLKSLLAQLPMDKALKQCWQNRLL